MVAPATGYQDYITSAIRGYLQGWWYVPTTNLQPS